MVDGFMLNNQLTDFSFADPRRPAGRQPVEPGKRPRSSMAPTMVLDHDGRLLLCWARPAAAASSPMWPRR